jgi:hypothetical protein
VEDPATGALDLLFDVGADDISIDPDLSAPRTLQYSAGFEHQLRNDISVGVQYVYKDTSNLVGWEILDGVYQTVPFTDPRTGNQLTLLSQIEQPVLRKGNDPGNFPGAEDLDYEQSYHGVVFSFNKRFSKNWGLMASYTLSKSEGLIPRMLEQTQFNPFYGNKRGSDPNNFINAYGRLQGDRPHMFRTQAVFRLPFDIDLAAAVNLETGKATTRQTTIGGLGQGTSRVILDRGGVNRFPNTRNVDLTVGKRVVVGSATLKFDAWIYNLLNSDTAWEYASLILRNPGEDFVATRWFQPRRLMVRLGLDF